MQSVTCSCCRGGNLADLLLEVGGRGKTLITYLLIPYFLLVQVRPETSYQHVCVHTNNRPSAVPHSVSGVMPSLSYMCS